MIDPRYGLGGNNMDLYLSQQQQMANTINILGRPTQWQDACSSMPMVGNTNDQLLLLEE